MSWGGWRAQPDMPTAACFPSSRGTRELILVPQELRRAARLGSCQLLPHPAGPSAAIAVTTVLKQHLKKKKSPLDLL